MAKGSTPTPTNNVFKNIVRTVVREELAPVRGEIRADLVSFKAEVLEGVRGQLKEFRSELGGMKDEIVGELKTARQEQTMHQGQHEHFHEIETRVEKLEEIHPQGQHLQI